MTKKLRSNNRGFTIIELMIATTVLSVILLLVTTMMISIGNLFYKGINEAHIQDAIRNTTTEVSQQLQLTDAKPTNGFDAFDGASVYCIGSTRYTYVLNTQTSTMPGGYQHLLWRDTVGNCDTTTGADLQSGTPSTRGPGTNGVELVPPLSRLTAFCIGAVQPAALVNNCGFNMNSPYTISVSMAFGDGVTDPALFNLAGFTTTCQTRVGDQFCAAASLQTTVVARIPK